MDAAKSPRTIAHHFAHHLLRSADVARAHVIYPTLRLPPWPSHATICKESRNDSLRNTWISRVHTNAWALFYPVSIFTCCTVFLSCPYQWSHALRENLVSHHIAENILFLTGNPFPPQPIYFSTPPLPAHSFIPLGKLLPYI